MSPKGVPRDLQRGPRRLLEDREERARAMNIWVTCSAIGLPLGPIVAALAEPLRVGRGCRLRGGPDCRVSHAAPQLHLPTMCAARRIARPVQAPLIALVMVAATVAGSET
jgi:hypothetical protein